MSRKRKILLAESRKEMHTYTNLDRMANKQTIDTQILQTSDRGYQPQSHMEPNSTCAPNANVWLLWSVMAIVTCDYPTYLMY